MFRNSLRRASLLPVYAAALIAACGQPARPRHPMDPLDASEIRAVQAALNARGLLAGRRVVLLDLHEPRKSEVLARRTAPREAFVVLYDAPHNATSEAIVDVATRQVRSWRVIPGVQPAIDAADAMLTDSLVRASDQWRAALKRRGIARPSDVVVFAWSAGDFGPEDAPSRRLARAVTYVRAASINEMSRPVEGLVALVDLSARRVTRVDDKGLEPIPDAASERDVWQPLAPPTTPEPNALPWAAIPRAVGGPRVDEHTVSWRRWRFHVALRPREGMVLSNVGFDDGIRVRSILYRASLSEMVVPYGDPAEGWYFRNSFDVGELGMGGGVAALQPGVDCPPNATFIDAIMANDRAEPRTIPRALALYERDGGLAWKHGNVSRRARELVVFSVSRLGNYDYGFEWIFHEDGTIAHRILLTGVMTPKGVQADAHGDSLAHRVARGVDAVHHQHFFNYRLDFDVDGAAPNQVEEVETHALAAGAANPRGGAFAMHSHVLATELSARRELDAHTSRHWRVTSSVRNSLGEPTAYALIPEANADPFALPGSSIRRRAGFLDAHVWATQYSDTERYAAGEYPNQSPGGDGLVRWTAGDRSLIGGDVVLWYTVGVTHNPRPEDWPVMPVHEAGFRLIPLGFFDRNPALGNR